MAERELISEELLNEEEIETDQYLLFTIGSQVFGIQAMRVQEISRMMEATGVPNAPPHIEGIVNLRGRLATVINFRKKFGYQPREYDEDTRIIIVDQEGFPIGVIVDAVSEVIRIPESQVQKLPEQTTTAVSKNYLAGVGVVDSSLVILLDVDRMLEKTELQEAADMEQAINDVRSMAGRRVQERPAPAARDGSPEKAGGEPGSEPHTKKMHKRISKNQASKRGG